MEIREQELLSKESLPYVFKYCGIKDVPGAINETIASWIGGYTIEQILDACNICFARLSTFNAKYIDGVLRKKYIRYDDSASASGQHIPINADIKKSFIEYCEKNNINPVEKLEEFMDQYSKGAEILYTNKF